ncbi:hypothetical protein VNO80_17135 [Phaseolus coccineus]|uniref:Uncharacterized protein n=1 Tax=Phaseolus coccineus TaxID=3886 RepID=A0AAN9MSW2_PHACN
MDDETLKQNETSPLVMLCDGNEDECSEGQADMFKQNVTGHKSRTMKPHTYAGYLFPSEEEWAKKSNFTSIDKASLTVHSCVHNY